MIYLFRHGETIYNVENKFLGKTDLDLCKNGVVMFENISKAFKSKNLKAVYCSELKRAVQSAEIIAKNLNIPLFIRSGLNERDVGYLEGKNRGDIRYVSVIPKLINLKFRPPGACSAIRHLRDFSAEIEKIANNIKENIAVVSHGGIIALYLKHIIKVREEDIFINNGCYHVLDRNNHGKMCINAINQTI